jgi:sugar transferase (PEP-CTERM/EpsH1 system associated)
MSQRPKKILHILHSFYHGGLENGLVNIINASPPYLEHELCLLTTAGEFINRLQKPIRYYELHKQPGNSLKIILQLRRAIRESRADIVHTRNWGAFDGVIAACFCPRVTVLHGEHGRDISDPQGLNRRRNLLRQLFSPRIRKFTVVSDDLSRWLRNKVGIPKDKIVLIPNGVDTERFRPHRDPDLRMELGIADDEFVIGTIGRLDPVKNHAGLIRAHAILAKKASKVRLIIVCDGPEKQKLENLVKSLAVSPPPIITGYREDTERFYGIFDVFVLNSFAEGMSNTLSSGLPIVCTPVGANIDLVEDRIRGRFVPTDDEACLAESLDEYRTSPDLSANIGLAARQFIERSYSLSNMTSQYKELYLGF